MSNQYESLKLHRHILLGTKADS